MDFYEKVLIGRCNDLNLRSPEFSFDSNNVARTISTTLDDTVVKQQYLGGYIEIQPDSWDGTATETDATTKTWGFPMSLLPTERARIKNDVFNGDGKNIMYIRFPLGFAYRGYRNIDGVSGLAKNIGERFSGQNATLKSWFDKISISGGGLAPEYWCPPPHWVTSGSYHGDNKLRAGGAYPMTTTLASIRVSDATQYNAQISAFTDSVVDDLEYLHQNIAPVRMFGLQNEPVYNQMLYGACQYGSQTYNDVLSVLYPKILASTILSTYNDESNVVKLLVASSDESSPFTGIASTFITNHSEWIWGYTHHSMRKASGESYADGADWYKTTEFSDIKGSKTNVFINEYEYFDKDFGHDEFRCSNNMLHLINESVYGEAQVLHPVIHICKPLGQTLSATNTKGYCLYQTNLNGDYGISEANEANTLSLAKGTVSPNVTMYNSWALIGQNLPVGAYLVGNYTDTIDRAGWCVYKYNGKLFLFFANNSNEDVGITITFKSIKRFDGKFYNLLSCGDKIKSKEGTDLTFVVPAYSGQAWIENNLQQSDMIISDSFDRANSNTTLGKADTGQSWFYAGTSAVFGISNNKAICVSSDGAGAYALMDTGLKDLAVSCDFIYNKYSSFALRYADVDNHYRVRINSSGLGIFKVVASVATSLASYAVTPIIGTTYNIKVIFDSNNIKVYLDGVLRIDINDSTYPNGTKYGLYTGANNTLEKYDNFLVELLD